MQRTNKTQYTILGMLAIRPMSGYEIQHSMKKSTSYFWSESAGQIYPTLAKLLKGKYISSSEAYNGKRVSKIYQLTNKGTLVLKEWLPQKATKQPHRDEVLLKLFFGKNMSQKQCLSLVIKRKQDNEEYLQELLSIKKDLAQTFADNPNLLYWMITLDHGLYSTRAEVEWCNEAARLLKSTVSQGVKND